MQVVVCNLTKRYPGTVAAADVSFEVPKGKLLTLLGPSGSGKTTTLMMIAGFVTPDRGRIEVAGREVTSLPPNKRDLGVVFQSYAVFPHKTVFENVAFPLGIRKVPRAEIVRRVTRMLELVKLGDFGDRGVGTLSGGQKQRVALARALVFEPPVLLMDEPLGALDKKLREHMQVEIKSLQESLGVTAIYVTHDQAEALSLSDTIAVMNEGRLVQLGTPAELYEEPASRFVADFLGGVNLFAASDAAEAGDGFVATLAGGVRAPCHFPGKSAGAPPGSRRWLGIRPERVRLCADGAAGVLFAARVVKRVYLGEAMQYEVRPHAGTTLIAKLPLAGAPRVWEIGATVGVTWTPRDAWLLE
ncbi:MAG: ABC transporter ATP-binding protein [Candidatus Rokubacteria bacterium]|nr:ABC transporter ATP-binding protein [Candidatus Rokubacteria bacterium]